MKFTILVLMNSLFFIPLNARYNDTIAKPWGVDSELTSPCPLLTHELTQVEMASLYGKKCGLSYTKRDKMQATKPQRSVIQSICIRMIRFFQIYISPIDGPRSTFYPTSSQYTLDAIHKYGVCQGIALGCDRLMRENKEEWVYRKIDKHGIKRKFDPIPHTRHLSSHFSPLFEKTRTLYQSSDSSPSRGSHLKCQKDDFSRKVARNAS